MGTNYYFHEEVPCEKCGHRPEGRHIGKSSCGWCFALRIYPDDGINDLGDWARIWVAVDGGTIENEDGYKIELAEMIEIICNRRGPDREETNAWYEENPVAMPGPNNLVRHRTGGGCVGHGEGTWDLLIGEFS